MTETAAGNETTAYETVEAVVRAQLTKALGGVRGVVEAAVPTIAFTGTYVFAHQLRLSLIIAGAAAVLELVLRVVQRSSPQFVLNAVFGTAIAAFFALRSGKAQDAFVPGMLYTAGVTALMLVSVVVRWPFVGFMVGATNPEDPLAWRRNPAIVRLAGRLSLILLLPGVLKLSVQIPLYLSGQVFWLGVSKIALGWPAYLGALAIGIYLLLRGHTPLHPENQTAPAMHPTPPTPGA